MEHYKELQATKVFQDASEFECQAMMFCFKTRFILYEKNSKIIKQGDPLNEIALLLKGSAIVQHNDMAGEINVINELKKGDCYGLESAFAKHDFFAEDVVAKEKCLVLFMNRHRLLNQCDNRCKRHEFVLKNLMSMIVDSNVQLIEKLNCISKRTTREKLLMYFSLMSKKQNSAYFDIPFNKTELASYLCVDRSAMSSELGKMKEEGIIDYDKKQFRLKKSMDI